MESFPPDAAGPAGPLALPMAHLLPSGARETLGLLHSAGWVVAAAQLGRAGLPPVWLCAQSGPGWVHGPRRADGSFWLVLFPAPHLAESLTLPVTGPPAPAFSGNVGKMQATRPLDNPQGGKVETA